MITPSKTGKVDIKIKSLSDERRGKSSGERERLNGPKLSISSKTAAVSDCLAVKAGKMHFLHHSAHLPVLLLQSPRLLGHLVIKPSRHDLRGMSDPEADRFPPLSPNRWWFSVSGYYS